MVYRRKTWPSDFQRRFGRPIFYHQDSFAETETNGSQTVQGLGYTVDASKLPNQVSSIFYESSKMCVAAHCHGGTQLPFCWPILVALSGLIRSNSQAVHITGPN